MLAPFASRFAALLTWLVLTAAASSAAAPAPAPPPAAAVAPLELETVLRQAALHYPSIITALRERDQAVGERTSAEGAFDLLFEADGLAYLGGFYNGRALQSRATQPLRNFGGELYAGFDLSAGELPIYYDEYFTNTAGRPKVGVLFSLLRDRTIDDRRYQLRDAELAVRSADLELLMTRIGVQRAAASAYWYWRALGAQLRAYENLLSLSLARDDGLRTEVKEGARARIELVENARNITNRRILVTDARAAFNKAANALALYYRDENARMQVPSRGQLPPVPMVDPHGGEPESSRPTMALLPAVLARHPALAQLNVALSRAEVELELARNELKPQLDLSFELASQLGAVGQGGVSRDSTDPLVGLEFKVPLQRRKARGRVSATESERDALRAEQALKRDQLTRQFSDLLVELEAAGALETLAALELDQNRQLVRAENRRFEQGASDFFLVNLREVTAANAEVALLKASLRRNLARTEIDAAVLDFEALGLPSALTGP